MYTIVKAGSVELDEDMKRALKRIRIRPHSFVKKLVGDKGYKLRVKDNTLYLDITDDEIQVIAIR